MISIIRTFLYAHNDRYIVTTILTNDGECTDQHNTIQNTLATVFKREFKLDSSFDSYFTFQESMKTVLHFI